MHVTPASSQPSHLTHVARSAPAHPAHPASGTHSSVVKAAQTEKIAQEKFDASKAVANEHAIPKLEAKQPGVGDQVNMTA